MPTKHFRLVPVPAGAYGPTYSPGSAQRRRAEQAQRDAKSPQQVEAENQAVFRIKRDLGISWGVAPEDIEFWLSDPQGYRAMIVQRQAQERALEKIQDMGARTSVEGNTDINHDNLEG
jgi:hypothetical protein